MSQPKETLKFRIGLSGTFWDKVPLFSIAINDTIYVSGLINSTETKYYEFTTDLEEDAEFILKIRLENKTDSDTVQNENKTEILKDMLLNIDQIEIDDIDLADLKWTHSEFIADDTTRPTLKKCVNLGWNGSYELKFRTPFYLWLLESM
jgi:hypothetical protein